MFRAAMRPSSGELIVSIRHLVYVTLYNDRLACKFGWGSSKPGHQTVIYTEWHIPDAHLDTWLAVHHSITFLLLPTWYTNFLFIHTNYNKLNSSTCFERNPLIIRRSTTQIVHMRSLVSSLSASDRLVQPLRKDSIKLNSSTCFERNPLIIRRSTTQIVHMQSLVSSLSASDLP